MAKNLFKNLIIIFFLISNSALAAYVQSIERLEGSAVVIGKALE